MKKKILMKKKFDSSYPYFFYNITQTDKRLNIKVY